MKHLRSFCAHVHSKELGGSSLTLYLQLIHVFFFFSLLLLYLCLVFCLEKSQKGKSGTGIFFRMCLVFSSLMPPTILLHPLLSLADAFHMLSNCFLPPLIFSALYPPTRVYIYRFSAYYGFF